MASVEDYTPTSLVVLFCRVMMPNQRAFGRVRAYAAAGLDADIDQLALAQRPINSWHGDRGEVDLSVHQWLEHGERKTYFAALRHPFH
jgi:hypothetical protein